MVEAPKAVEAAPVAAAPKAVEAAPVVEAPKPVDTAPAAVTADERQDARPVQSSMLEVDPTQPAPEKAAPAPVARTEAAPAAPVVHNGQLFGNAGSDTPASTDAAAQAAQAEAREDIPTDVAQAEEAGTPDQDKHDKA